MTRLAAALVALCLPLAAHAEGIVVRDAYVPLAPPGAMAHAAYMTITNEGAQTRHLIAVRAQGYHMAHLHMNMDQDGVASMAPVHQISLAPGQSLILQPGKMHVMLMKPMQALHPESEIALALEFANGETVAVTAPVMLRHEGS